MTDSVSNTKQIAKNTMFLYIRMLVMMVVSLFTFRELLKQLGVDDYGTYNVVGGIVILFSFLSNAMTQANQRFLAYHIGKGDKKELNKVFSMIVNVQILIVLIIIFLSESIGLWFLNTQMNFAGNQMTAVNWVYQFSIITFVIQLLQIPYTSAIIAHERMAFFSYFCVGEAFLRLGVVFALGFFMNGRLVIYTGLLTASSVCIWIVYFFYCNKSFSSCDYKYFWDKPMLKRLASFSGWNMLGGLGNVGANQGVNILFNIFYGVALNAAMGIANQVSAAVNSLVSNMQVAFSPQIIKAYAAGETSSFNALIFQSARFSFYLIYMIGLPMIFCAKPILDIWLPDVPEYAISFTQLTIVFCIIDALSGALWIGAQATGKIRNYTLILASILFLNLPFAYVILKSGFIPTYVILLRVILVFGMHIYRIIYLSYATSFSGMLFFKRVTLMAIFTALISLPFPFFLREILGASIHAYIILFFLCLIEVIIIGFYLLLSKKERNFILIKVKTFLDYKLAK